METNELTHHGILGQKWGVRRYQNKDGTLTTAGKKRYSSETPSIVSREKPKMPTGVIMDGPQHPKMPKGAISMLTGGKPKMPTGVIMDGPQNPQMPKGVLTSVPQNPKTPLGVETRSMKSQEQRESERQKKIDNRERGTLSDAELEQKVHRLEMEQKLDRLTKDQITRGEEYVTGILKDIGRKVLVTAGAGALLYGIKVATGGQFDAGDFGDSVFRGGAKKK